MDQVFRIVSPVYNARPWIDRYVQSVTSQTYPHWTATIIDDASDDGTYERLCELTAGDDRITVIRNRERRRALANVVDAISRMRYNDEDVIVFLDGDDWFSDTDVLDYLNQVYQDEDVWITWGSYLFHPSGEQCRNAKRLPFFYDVRKDHFIFSHLKTARHFLWRNIADADLRDRRTGEYYRASWDNAVMRPMVEMAGRKHSRFIKRPLYIYNTENPMNIQKGNPSLHKEMKQDIRGRTPYRRKTKQELLEKRKMRVILTLTPWVKQKNLGDHAQAILIERWIKKQWPEAHFSEYDIRQTDDLVQETLAPEDLIILCSGGNVGDVWIEAEYARRKILETFTANRILSLAQTIDFRDPAELEISKRIYNAHPDLTFCARDGYSYALAREHFSNAKILLAPDIVLTHKHTRRLDRKGVLLCLRLDKLSTLTQELADEIKARCEAAGYAGQFINTRIDRPVPNRRAFCEEMWDTFAASEGVITNRLHGTIFSIITSTPCVIIPPANHKISEAHFWLRHIPFVRFCHRIEEAADLLKEVMAESCDYDPNWAREYYDGLVSRMNGKRICVKEEALLGLLQSCRSAHAWSSLKISSPVIADIVRAGSCAPFDADGQRLRFRVVSEPDEITDLADRYLAQRDDLPSHIICVGCDATPASDRGPEEDAAGRDAVIAAVQNMRLYCEAIGVSTCMLSRRGDADFAAGIALGYAKEKT